MVDGLVQIDLLANPMEWAVERVIVIDTQECAECVELKQKLEGASVRAYYHQIAGSAGWSAVNGFSSAVLPPQVLERVVRALEDEAGE
jgi:hypothetical protein